MKHKIGFAGIQSSWMIFLLLLICLGTGCEKAGQIHLISAQTWVVTSVSSASNIATVGDELVFHDNRLFFNTSNGVETDGKWDFLGQKESGFAPFNVTGVSIFSDLGSYDFTIDTLTNKVLELSDNSSWGSFTIKLVAKE
ncbi:MAG: hypothetical protein ACI976_000252 [Aureispira sp.]|jgi:hypothetical protein